VETVFTRFDRIPVASGSIAQVHRAVMRDGRVVAVKVRRPGTVRRVNADFAVLRAIARLVARLPLFHSLPVCDLVEEIARPVEQQLDFRLEAQNHRTLRREFEHTERLSIPALVDHLCTDCVLTMAYVEGLHDCTAERWPEDERRAAGLTALRVLYRMIFEIGLVHADMHPGNVFLQRNGKVALLDMGLVAKLSPADRHDFVDFFFGLVTDRGDECARIVVQGASALGARYDPVQFVSAMRGLVSRHARRRSRDFEIATFVSELLALQRRFDVRGSTAFITTVLAMVVYDGVCKQLYPDCDFQAEARGFLILARYGRADLDVPRAG
jgi:ubiquinone biosynthesis protein